MTTYAASSGSRLLCATFIGLAMVAAMPAGSALARVGVTSAADGRPLGKPPNANERILRIGIDVQANELVTTAANDRAHLVFLDGSSLTVGPNARLVIDRFVYDPNTQKGELAVNATKGVLRLVGGKISKTTPITITTPSSTIGIRGGITIISVTQIQTIADFIFGTSMTVTGGGVTQTATRAGSQIIANLGTAPGAPTLIKAGSLNAALNQLEGGTSNNNKSPDQSAQSSGFSSRNSGQPPNVTNVTQNLPPNPNNNTLATALSNSSGAENPIGNATPVAAPNKPPTPPTPPTPPQPPTTTGFASGMLVTQRADGERSGTTINVRPLTPGTISVTRNSATRTAQGTIVIPLHSANDSSAARSSNQPTIATFRLSGASPNSNTYLLTTNPSRPSTVQQGSQTYPLPNATLLATNNLANIPLQGRPGACTCEYLTWGWWLSAFSDPTQGRPNANLLIGNFVNGTPTSAVQLPQTGSATYNGFMVGAVNNNGQGYAAGGSYQMNWSFQNRAGSFNGNFDRTSYAGSVGAQPGSGGASFSGNFSGGGRQGSMNGAFYGPGAANQGGAFTIGSAGSQYQATGIFGGQRR